MLRSLVLFLITVLLFAPSTAAALTTCAPDDQVVWTMTERDGRAGNDALLCPELVELNLTDDRVRRMLSEYSQLCTEAPPAADVREPASRSTSGSCDDVVQCFRVAGVRLLTFGTAPPAINHI
jgi:hypothetical protein